MKHSIIFLLWIAAWGWVGEARSQNIQYFGLFPTLDLSGKIAGHWDYNVYLFDAIKPYGNEIQGKHDDARSFWAHGELVVSYNITRHLSAAVSYGYDRQNPFRDAYLPENRFFQQLTLRLPLDNKGILNQRLRFDERFIKNRQTGETPFTHRLRYLLGIQQPLNNDNLYLMGYSEVFFNTSNHFKFDENWTTLQLGIRLNEHNSIEAGPLFIGWINNVKGDWLHQYHLQITWLLKMNFFS